MQIPKESYEADIALLDRFQSFSGEIVRIGILGIGLVGFFFIKDEVRSNWSIEASAVAAVLFAIAIAFALGHRFYSSDGIFYHLKFLREPVGAKKTECKAKRKLAFKRSERLLAVAAIASSGAALAAGIALAGAVAHLK